MNMKSVFWWKVCDSIIAEQVENLNFSLEERYFKFYVVGTFAW